MIALDQEHNGFTSPVERKACRPKRAVDATLELWHKHLRLPEGRLSVRLTGLSLVVLWLVILLLSWAPSAMSQEDTITIDDMTDITEISLEDLMNIVVTSVSKKADYEPKFRWFLRGSYSFLEVHVDGTQPGNATENGAPEQQFSVQSRFELPRNLEVDLTIRFVDHISDLGIPAYY